MVLFLWIVVFEPHSRSAFGFSRMLEGKLLHGKQNTKRSAAEHDNRTRYDADDRSNTKSAFSPSDGLVVTPPTGAVEEVVAAVLPVDSVVFPVFSVVSAVVWSAVVVESDGAVVSPGSS